MVDIKDFKLGEFESPEEFARRLRLSGYFGTLEIRSHIIRERLLRDIKHVNNIEGIRKTVENLIMETLYK